MSQLFIHFTHRFDILLRPFLLQQSNSQRNYDEKGGTRSYGWMIQSKDNRKEDGEGGEEDRTGHGQERDADGRDDK